MLTPSKNVHVSDADLLLFENAAKLAGGLIAAIRAALATPLVEELDI